MTNIDAEPQGDATDGTGAGIEEWFAWMIRTHEVAENTASGLRNGVRNVLQIDDEWRETDLTRLDLDNQIGRFRIAKRGKLSESSVEEYARRFKNSVESYIKWLDGDRDWQPAKSRPASTVKKGSPKKSPFAEERGTSASDRATSTLGADAETFGGDAVLDGPRMLRHNIPLKSGAIAIVQLPVDLTPADAKRIGRVVASLAMDDDGEDDNGSYPVRAIER